MVSLAAFIQGFYSSGLYKPLNAFFSLYCYQMAPLVCICPLQVTKLFWLSSVLAGLAPAQGGANSSEGDVLLDQGSRAWSCHPRQSFRSFHWLIQLGMRRLWICSVISCSVLGRKESTCTFCNDYRPCIRSVRNPCVWVYECSNFRKKCVTPWSVYFIYFKLGALARPGCCHKIFQEFEIYWDLSDFPF